MNTSKTPRRVLFLLTAIALLVCGIFLSRNSMRNAETGAEEQISRQTAPRSGTDATPPSAPSRKLEEPSITYVSQHGGETLKLVMDRFVARSAVGQDEIVALNPVATPATLAKRLAEHKAPRGVFPLAYDETDTYDGFRTITSEIRAKMPRKEAERFAREHGLTIAALPDYAPEWVIFAAADPFDALEKIESVRGEPEVEAADVLTGRRAITMALPNDPLVGKQWHLKASGAALAGSDMNVEGAWKYGATGGVLGRGIKIGIIDTGIQNNHPDFVGNIDTTLDKDFITGDGNSDPVYDDEDHGTAVGGVAGARGNNALGVSGVAPEATLVGSRLITGDFTSDSQNAEALAHRVDVIQIKNNSWGYGGSLYKTEPLLEAALKNSSENGRGGKGTIFAFAAGNDGDDQDSANYSELTSSIYTLTVGATGSKNKRAVYSEPGANVVISAPSLGGFNDGTLGITTADRTGTDGYNGAGGAAGNYTDDFSGTSSSCPAVSGGIALMLEKNPNLGWRDVHEILIRTAKKIDPGNPGWATNAAGLHFNNDFGAGLIDATAAVNMAGTWTNLGPQTALPSTKNGLLLSIPDNSSTGRSVLFNLPGSNIITEHVTVRLTIDHSARGHLEITLFSPSGTASRLAEVRSDLGQNYSDYTFSTVQNWGENSSGTWTLKVADRKSGNSNNGGTIKAAEIVVYGVFAPPVNPPPDVRITAPTEGSIFSPGVGFNVTVEATDLDIDSNPDNVVKVDLYQNDVLVATDVGAPYQFLRNPANGFYSYVAKATDSDGLEGESPPVFVVVRNQTPVIASATLNAGNQAYDDLPLTVTNVSATDPENDAVTFSYRWEYSVDEENYTDSGLTGATLAPNPDHSGKLWRCAITATDNFMNVSLPYLTATVNLLDRPSGLPVRPGGDYTYQSGLVLKGDTLIINRQAIIHEFSQGPLGGTSEWIEILTLQPGSLSDWSLSDGSGKSLRFAAGAWDNIPAGTLIVVYNGTTPTPKDPLIPANSNDPLSGAMVLSSADTEFFTESSVWPTLDNLGDSIYLKNSVGLSIHEVSYGNSVFANPNVGRVGSGEAAYFAGLSDAGANLSNEWLRTTSSIARTSSFSAAAPLAIFPGAIFTNGQYRQDFDISPGADGTNFPTGWSAYSVSITNTQTTNFDDLLLPAEASSVGGVFNFGSRVGILGGTTIAGGNRFDPGFFALAIDNTRNLTGLQISYDIIKISEITNSRSMLVSLEYTTGNPQNTGTPWFPITGTNHLTGTLPKNTLTRYNNVTLPSIFTNRESPIYLRWYYRTDPNGNGGGGAGPRDAIAIDNLVISSDSSPNIFMNVSLNPSTISEAAGANASVGTVTISKALSIALTVGISSSDTGEAAVPSSVIIPAGNLSATFPIAAVDDILADGTQSSIISLSAPGFLNVSKPITITDNEPIQVGVTPALPNNVSNAEFVARIREGRLTEAATFRLADGSVLPLGLSLSTSTGLISGALSPSAAIGTYTVIIERRNVLGGFTSQTIVIVVSESAAISYSEWVGGSGVDDVTVEGDSDLDSLPNLVEYALGSLPDSFDNPAPIITDHDEDTIWITYTKSKDVIDVTLVVEWSPSLEEATWASTDITHEIIVDGVNSQTIRSSVAIDPSNPLKFLRLHASLPAPPE